MIKFIVEITPETDNHNSYPNVVSFTGGDKYISIELDNDREITFNATEFKQLLKLL